MIRASYPRAVELLSLGDDVAWAYRDDLTLSDAARLVGDLFDMSPRTLAHDVRKYRTREGLPDGR